MVTVFKHNINIILPEGPRELAPNRFLLFFSTLTTPSGRDCSLHTLATTMAANKDMGEKKEKKKISQLRAVPPE